MSTAHTQWPTSPQELLWSVRDRLIDEIPEATADTVRVVSDLESVDDAHQFAQDFQFLVEGGDIIPPTGEGWNGGDVHNLTSVFRFNVQVRKPTITDTPDDVDHHLVELQSNIYIQAARVIYTLGRDLLRNRSTEVRMIGSENPVPQGVFYSRKENRYAALTVPFDVTFDWDVVGVAAGS